MATTFVTGGTGFLGSYILRYLLSNGEQVRALKRSSSRMDLVADIADKIEWVEGDILDVVALEDAMKGIKRVYHSAAVVSFNPKEKDWMFKVNIEGTANVVNLALEQGVKKLLFVSSISALGRDMNVQHMDETAKWVESPINSQYSISKFKAECEVWRGIEEGLTAAIVNPTIIVGSGYWNNSSTALFSTIANGLKFYPKGGTGFVDVRDVARASIGLMNSDISGERYIVSGEDLKWKGFFDTMAKYLNVPAPSREITGWQREFFWRVEWLRSRLTGGSPLVTRETVRLSAHHFFYDHSKLKKALNFEFTPIEQSLRESCEQYLLSKEKGLDFAILTNI